MNALVRTPRFDAWFRGLGDLRAKQVILARLTRVEQGNFGDCKSVGDGVRELRIDVGQGYRVYFVRRGPAVYLLLSDKGSQKRDIGQARAMARELEEDGDAG